MSTQKQNYEEALDELSIVRQSLQDIYIPVLTKFGKGTPERKDFLSLKADVDVAFFDLENTTLGAIALRMKEALPDVKKAKQKMAKRIAKLKTVQNAAKKVTKILGKLEKVVSLLV